MTNTLVDSNILIYSVQKTAGEKHEVASELIQGLMNSRRMALSTQNLAEFCRVALEKVSPVMTVEQVMTSLSGFSKLSAIIIYTDATVLRAVSISTKYQIHFFDALIAAAMQENGIEEILTENTEDFSKIPWIKARNPFSKS